MPLRHHGGNILQAEALCDHHVSSAAWELNTRADTSSETLRLRPSCFGMTAPMHLKASTWNSAKEKSTLHFMHLVHGVSVTIEELETPCSLSGSTSPLRLRYGNKCTAGCSTQILFHGWLKQLGLMPVDRVRHRTGIGDELRQNMR